MLRILVLLLFLLPIQTKALGEVDLIWEADTYTPPFYKGLPLWSKQSQIKFVAIENIPNKSPSTLIYRWSRDGKVIGSSSGVGQNTFTFSDSVLSLPTEIEIDVFEEEGQGSIGSASLVLRTIPSKSIVVEDNPLYGLMLNKAISGEFIIKEDESSFGAIPFFENVSARFAPAITYTWSTNTGDRRLGETVTYRAPEKGEGTASITLTTSNKKTLSEPTRNNFLIRFNKQNDF